MQKMQIGFIRPVLVISCVVTIFAGNDNYPNHQFVFEALKNVDFKSREQNQPNKLRVLENIRVSGSAQFSKMSLEEIIRKIKAHDNFPIVILDVRQEMHLLGDGDLSQTIAEKDWSEINHKLEFIIKDEDALVQPGLLEREEIIVDKLGLKYLRVPVTDDSVPSERAVDTFLEFYKEQIKNHQNTWFHVHCEHGHGRTTTFMSMLHILNTQGKIRLSDILEEQCVSGGADLSFPLKKKLESKDLHLQQERFAFLEEFHQYVNDREVGFCAGKSWSEWKKNVSEIAE